VTPRPFMAQAEAMVRSRLDGTLQEALDSAVKEA
jgi:hypothetical protein